MQDIDTALRSLATTWDPALRSDPSPEEATAAAVLREPVVEHFRADGKEIAPFPMLATELASSRREWDVAPLVALVGRDPVIAARVIRAANSVFYAGVREVETLREAVVRMGTRASASVAITAAMRALFDSEARAIQQRFGGLWDRLWQHSVRTAAGARWLAQRVGKGDPERAFLGGLLHDVGKTFALRSLAALIVEGRMHETVADRLAWELVEAAHVEVGTEVAVFWSFPEFLSAICMLHHGAAAAPWEEVHLVRIASAVDDLVSNPWHRAGLDAEIAASCAALGVQPQLLVDLAAELGALGDKASAGI